MNPLWTIVIPTTWDRRVLFERLLKEVWRQVEENDALHLIEIISDEDNKEVSIGFKRQRMLEKAQGVFISGLDSDDWIGVDYVKDILEALKNNPETDHVGFLEECDINGEMSLSIFSIRHQKWAENYDGYDHVRCANPKSVIRRTKALEVGYKDLRYAEDIDFSERVTPLLQSEVFINKPLYYYRHISTPHNERYGLDKQ